MTKDAGFLWKSLVDQMVPSHYSTSIFARLKQSYGEPDRHYHNLHHVVDCLTILALYTTPLEDDLAIRIALWFHDMIYDVRRKDNEIKSSKAARQMLTGTGLDARFIGTVCRLIEVTDHKQPVKTEAEKIIADVDMTILGSEPEQYKRYSKQIRQEYSVFTDQEFKRGRTAFLDHFLTKDRIYHTQFYNDMYEQKARNNMQREYAGEFFI